MRCFIVALCLIGLSAYGQVANPPPSTLKTSAAGQVETQGELVNVNGNPLGVDTSTRTLQTISYAHHEIHSGSHYFVRDWLNLTDSGTEQDYLIVTADTNKFAHMVLRLTSEAEYQFDFYEDAGVSSNGTEVTTFNNNRNSSKTATLKHYSSPGITNVGTQLWSIRIGAGGNRSTAAARDDAEYVLKRDTKYLLRVTKRAGNTDWFAYELLWYEHTDKTD